MLKRFMYCMQAAAVGCSLVLLTFHSRLWDSPAAALRGGIIVMLLVSSALGALPPLVARVVTDELRKLGAAERVRLLENDLEKTGTEGGRNGRRPVSVLRDSKG